jgi:RimJ/RimL family protein N-acetyltransferase
MIRGLFCGAEILPMTSLDLPIECERLMLRTFERTDIDQLSTFYGLPEAQRYYDLKARDREDVKAALEMMRLQTRLTRPGDTLTLAVERKSDERLVGHVSLTWTDATASQAELRFFFDPAVRRQNYGAECVRKLIDIGFDEFGFHRMFAARRGCSRISACGSRRTIGSMRCSRASGTRSCISPFSTANGSAAAR